MEPLGPVAVLKDRVGWSISTVSPAAQVPEGHAADHTLSEELKPVENTQIPEAFPRAGFSNPSPKVYALHSRLALPKKFPLETLARTLRDASADPHPHFNNASLAVLGHDLLAQYTTEHIICTYPRLPMTVIYAAMYAYIGPRTLATIAGEWGVELAAVPGPEVDPGLLQFKRVQPGTEIVQDPKKTTRPNTHWRKSIASSVVHGDIFGEPDLKTKNPKYVRPQLPDLESLPGVTAEKATSTFVQAVVGGIYLHAGRPAAKRFFKEHIVSRHLDMSKLFSFTQPARDLATLCHRENIEPPVAKIISETGRHSRHPVFNVGVFSGQDKLGEGSGASLIEARTRAAVAALKGWYLYSPLEVRVPSSTEEEGAKPWKPVYVDHGEVFV
ncbi:60S ribosomal protein L3 [Talaromyces stipitatus ATCC 10500]|uniref:Large ribosomal subunit protein mL44 n=1 Tax=Talaromyces stipitatus (strain ATCC 10500 / CBS 375.48 / QM 6759 / NRRL 1006) TaxID=441959 RepID=B8M2E6_TALSN|nr:mitochondrial 54S ribosomal protein YmL3 [Talaromyces stipitatus ATCC 10500]EED21610.1 60S ribosomal protein L3 [Talaromyces stipitatus ATCC 10500]